MTIFAVGLTATALALTGCAADTADGIENKMSSDSVWATATSTAEHGGMEALVKAAQEEGELNVIALPDNWANYGLIKAAFTEKYGIKINDNLPDASSKEEIDTAEKNKGTSVAPDVFDLGANVALSSTEYFAPYKVEAWDSIPDQNKESTGLWVNDYTGMMSIGYNKTKYGSISGLDELFDSKFSGQVALNGKPAEAGAAFNGFLMVNNAQLGDFTNVDPGLEFFKKMKEAGTLNLQDVTDGTIASGTHGVVFDWSYNQVSYQQSLKENGVEWEFFVPEGGEIVSYYNQAVNVDAPHPAAARLWQEFLYSPVVQNLWLLGGARPVLFDAMQADRTLDPEWDKYLPKTSNEAKTPTPEEAETLTAVIKEKWDTTVQ